MRGRLAGAVLQIAIRLLAPIVIRLGSVFCRATGDFLIDLATLNYFRDHSKVAVSDKEEHPVPEAAAALIGFAFWAAFAAAVYFSWPWLSSW